MLIESVIVGIFGLVFGSFVTALTWRVDKGMSMARDRSRCDSCHKVLEPRDLVPLLSWLMNRGRCRYCAKKVSWQYPAIELATSGLFVLSYLAWPQDPVGVDSYAIFGLWLAIVVGFVALTVYDMRHYLLPNVMMFPVAILAGAYALIQLVQSQDIVPSLLNLVVSVAISGGIYWALYMISKGQWIGGGDIKLGLIVGLIVMTPAKALGVLTLSSLIGSLGVMPLILLRKRSMTSRIPYGPMIMAATIVMVLYGDQIITWYQTALGV